MVDVSGPVSAILDPYRRLLDRYRTDVTGDPAAVRRSADTHRVRAAEVRSVADAIFGRSKTLATGWEAPEQRAFHTAATDLATRMIIGTEQDLLRTADRLRTAAGALATARTSVDGAIARFDAAAKILIMCARWAPDGPAEPLFDRARQLGGDAARRVQRIALDLGRTLAGLFDQPGQFGKAEFGLRAPYGPNNPLKVAVLGNSFGAGEGVGEGTKAGIARYYDAEDPRHRSPFAAALQALSRVRQQNPSVPIEAYFAASSGAVTRDLVVDQTMPDRLVNEAQLFQIPKDAGVVVADFGGNDALFAPVITAAHGFRDEPAQFRSLLDEAGRFLSDRDGSGRPYTVEDYRNQAATHDVGHAPTLVARWLQVIDEIRTRAPDALIVVPNYPDAVNPKALDNSSWLSATQGRAIERELVNPLNAALRTAVEIAGPGVVLADVSKSLEQHEVYTDNPWINGLDPYFSNRDGWWGSTNTWAAQEPFHPNDRGYGSMADPIAKAIADVADLAPPGIPAQETVTSPDNIRVIQAFSDFDGDGIPNGQDPTPGRPTFHGRVTNR